MTLESKAPDLAPLISELELVLRDQTLLSNPQREELIKYVDMLNKQFRNQSYEEQKNTLKNILKALNEAQTSSDKRIKILSFLDNLAPRA
jgi:thioester reductase-like protein